MSKDQVRSTEEALKLALEALEDVDGAEWWTRSKALAAIKQALAAPVQEPAALKYRLVKIHDALGSHLGDTDPYIPEDMTDEEVCEYEPVFWAAKEIADLIGDAPWDKYTTPPAAQPAPAPLTGKQRTLLAQAWAMLEDYAQDQRSHGNDGFANGAEASAHEIKTMLTTPPAAPVQEPMFADIIAQHPGLAEELKAMDVAPVQEPVMWTTEWIASIKEDAEAIFCDTPASTPMIVSDIIEWYDATLRTTSPAAPVQEPVAWMWLHKTAGKVGVYFEDPVKFFDLTKPSDYEWTPLYTTPPAAQRPWVGLTDKDVYPLANENLHYQIEGYEVSGIYSLARAIEAKLKGKNT